MTSLSDVNDLFIHLVSMNLSPSVFAAFTLSDPAKSIKFNVALI